MRRSRILIALLPLIAFTVTANAADLFVSLSGNDANSGTLSAPFRTISKASQSAKPGDVVNVRGGVWNERASIGAKGTASARIVFRPYAGESVVFDGTTVPAGKMLVSLNQTEYVDFTGFEVRNSAYIAIGAWYAKNTRIMNNVVYSAQRNGIYAGGDVLGDSSNITVSGNTVYNTVRENELHNMGDGGWAGAVVVTLTNGATITSNRIYQNHGEGLIALRGNDMLVQNNEIYDNFSIELYVDNARFVTADRNLIYSTGNSRWFRNGQPAIGIGIANETNANMNPSSDNTFTNNVVIGSRFGFYYGNFESGGGLKNTKVLHNTFYGSVDEIIRIEDDANSNSVVQNNIFYQVGSKIPTKNGGTGVSYRNNLWYGGTAGAAAGAGDRYGDPLFVNAGGRKAADYKLRLLSPATHTALDIAAVSRDYFGQMRTPTSDIGAHELSTELGSSAPLTPLPVAPSSVNAAVAANAVNVSWAAATGSVSAYNVYRNGVFIDSVQATAFVDATVSADTTYVYEVSTLNVIRVESPRSVAATVTTPVAADSIDPSRPTALQGSTVSTVAIQISWNASTDNVGVRSYQVYRNGERVATVKSGTMHVDGGLQAGTTYSYYVVAVDAAGNRSSASEKVSVSTRTPGRSRAVR
jgi:parallel beta-helix repeat protein